jgi:predicted DNA-binding transcriptional regulator YafY
VKAVLRSPQKEKLEMLNDTIRLQTPPCFALNSDYLSVLQKAIAAKTILELEYKNNKEEISRRQAEPIGLVFYAMSWHLIGWCHTRKDYRDFRVSRINRLRNTDMPFTKSSHMALDEYMKLLPVNY